MDTNTAYESFRDWTLAVVIVFGSLIVVGALVGSFILLIATNGMNP